MCKKKEIRATDVRKSERDNASQIIAYYSTCLIHDSNLRGSGIFVKYESRYGILTAYHVAHGGASPFDFAIGSNDAVGLSLTNMQHAFYIETDMLRPHSIGIPRCEEEGPDMIFLEILDQEKVGTIKATRSFWDIRVDYKQRINELCQSKSCIWAVSGVPELWIDKTERSGNFDKPLVLYNLIGFGAAEKWFEKNGFDYFDIVADLSTENELPSSFGGMSGGGVWAIPWRTHQGSNAITLDTPILAGVIFYQTAMSSGQRIIRAHGAKSIYQNLINSLKA